MHNNYKCNNNKFEKHNAVYSGKIINSNTAEENVCSTSDRVPSRSNSNCEVHRTRVSIRNQTTNERSCSVPPRPCTRRNPTLLPQHFVKTGNPYPKFNDNCNTKKIPIKYEPASLRICQLSQPKNAIPETRKKCSMNCSNNPEYSKLQKISVKDNNDDHKKGCSSKPITRKTPIPTPRIIKISYAEKPIVAHDYEYLQFSLRITEDIIRNDLYTTKEMKRVFNSHIEANKGRLDMNKMLQQIDHLCTELNLSQRNTNQSTDEDICQAPKIEENNVESVTSSQSSVQSVLKNIKAKYELLEHDVQKENTEHVNNSVGENDTNVTKETNQNEEKEDKNEATTNVNVIHNNVDNFQLSLSEEFFKGISGVPSDETRTISTINKEENDEQNDKEVGKNTCYLSSYETIKNTLYDAINKMTQSNCKECNSFNTNMDMLKCVLQDILTSISIQEKCSGDGIEIQSTCSKDCKIMEQKSVQEILNIIENVSQLYLNNSVELEQNITEPNISSELLNNTNLLNDEDDKFEPHKVKCYYDKFIDKSEVSIVEPKIPIVNPENKCITFTDKTVQTSFVEDNNEMLKCDSNKDCKRDAYCCTAVKDVSCACGEQLINTPIEITESVYEVDNKVESKENISSITNYILECTFNAVDKKESMQDAQIQEENEPCLKKKSSILELEIPIKNILEINEYKNEIKGRCEDECIYKQSKQIDNKSEFVSKIECMLTASNRNLYQFPEKTENKHVNIPVCLKTLDKYETEYSKRYKKPTKQYKKQNNIVSQSDESISEGEVSRSTVDSGCCRKACNKVIKRDQPEILERLQKYERNIEKTNKLTLCLSDYEIENRDGESAYKFFTPKFSRSMFFPTVGTQTSNSNSSGYHDNLLSDGEIENTSSQFTDDTSGNNL